MFSRTWRSLLDSFPRRGPSRLVTALPASDRRTCPTVGGEHVAEWGHALARREHEGGEGTLVPRRTLPAGHGTPGLPLLPPSPEPRGLGVTPAEFSPGPQGYSREPPGNPPENRNSRPPEKRDFPARGNFPPARGPPRGGSPGTPQNWVFLEGYFVFFCALRVYTPLYPPKWPKKGSKKVSRFCPDWESY